LGGAAADFAILLLYNTFSPKIKALWGYKAAIHPFLPREIAALVKIAVSVLGSVRGNSATFRQEFSRNWP
jgi:hypothetical protein